MGILKQSLFIIPDVRVWLETIDLFIFKGRRA